MALAGASRRAEFALAALLLFQAPYATTFAPLGLERAAFRRGVAPIGLAPRASPRELARGFPGPRSVDREEPIHTPACARQHAVSWLPLMLTVLLGLGAVYPEGAGAYYSPHQSALDSSHRRVLHRDECSRMLHSRSPRASRKALCPRNTEQGHVDASVAKRAATMEDRLVLMGSLAPEPPADELPRLARRSAEDISMPVNMLLAFCASTFSTLLLHPIDTLKARLQLRSRGFPPNVQGHGGRVERKAGGGRPGPLRASLYSGIVANVAREGPSNALYLAVFEQIKVSLFHHPATRGFAQAVPVLALLLAGALGDSIGCVLTMPAEIAKRRLQTGASASYAQALVDAVSDDTSRMHTRAAVAAVLLRDIPEGALQIMLFEVWMALAAEHHDTYPFLDSLGGHLLLGMVAGGIAAVLTTPMDVAATNLAAANHAAGFREGEAAGATSLGVTDVMLDIFQRDGLAGLMSGAAHRAAYYGPIAGVFFSCFSALQQLVLDEGRVTYMMACVHRLPPLLLVHSLTWP